MSTQGITPSPPARRFMGKSSEYVVNYTQTYQREFIKGIRYLALGACCLGVIVGYYYISAKSSSSRGF